MSATPHRIVVTCWPDGHAGETPGEVVIDSAVVGDVFGGHLPRHQDLIEFADRLLMVFSVRWRPGEVAIYCSELVDAEPDEPPDIDGSYIDMG
jgi:hypothetical protein